MIFPKRKWFLLIEKKIYKTLDNDVSMLKILQKFDDPCPRDCFDRTILKNKKWQGNSRTLLRSSAEDRQKPLKKKKQMNLILEGSSLKTENPDKEKKKP